MSDYIYLKIPKEIFSGNAADNILISDRLLMHNRTECDKAIVCFEGGKK